MGTTTFVAAPRKDPVVATRLGRRRKRTDRLLLALALAATAIGLAFLASILATLLWRGMEAMSLRVFTDVTRPPGSEGGLLNAIVGSLIQTAIGTAVGTPIGLLVGTYLSEYARGSALGAAVRFVSDVLLSAPSILIGLFIYQLMVLPFGGFSGIAGAMALAVIVIPIVVRTTEDMLTLIPTALREAAVALGAPKWKMIVLVCYPAVRPGLITGALLGVARIAGETAPLLFTSLGNLTWSVDLTKAMSSLPVTIYAYAGSPYADWIALGWTGALLITVGVLAINIIARVVLRQKA
jgi:phosphate transport system permease protein